MDRFSSLIRKAAALSGEQRPGGSRERGATIKPFAHGALVEFSNGRRQTVRATRQGGRYVLSSVVIGRGRTETAGRVETLKRVWLHNRETDVVAFGLDDRDRLVGRVETFAATLEPAELAFYVETLARECDRFEFLLTGADR